MSTTKKRWRYLVPILIVIILGSGVGSFFCFALIPYTGKDNAQHLDITAAFDPEPNYAKTLDMGDKEQFVILNLADVQLCDMEPGRHTPTFAMLDRLIRTTQPDLITLTGDQVSGSYVLITLKKLCKFIDGYGIPWAPVLGNHDGQHNVTRNGNGDIYLSGQYKNVIFAKNDPAMGVGNYIINITRHSRSVHTMFMLDSHDSRVYSSGQKDYDYIWQNQIDWYEWAIEGICAANGGEVVPSSCFFHIPLVEYKDAYEGYCNGIYAGTGVNRESVCCAECKSDAPYNNGFYAKMKQLGSTHLVLVGHDHVNCSCIDYDGITLAYGLKSGYGSYHDDDMIGGTTVTIRADGSTSLDHYRYIEGTIVHDNNITGTQRTN